MTDNSMTPEQIAFTNSFNRQRSVLAAFASCWTLDELHIVRDGLYLGLASDLLPSEYAPIKEAIVTNDTVAATQGTAGGFPATIRLARGVAEWPELVEAVLKLAKKVGCDLPGIWKNLETGRMEWLHAISGAHTLKMLLREALKRDKATTSIGDVSDAKMLWIYALSLNIPSLKPASEKWAETVQMKDPLRPLVKYQAELWDARHENWKPLDLGVQEAAGRGGSSIEVSWDARFNPEENK